LSKLDAFKDMWDTKFRQHIKDGEDNYKQVALSLNEWIKNPDSFDEEDDNVKTFVLTCCALYCYSQLVVATTKETKEEKYYKVLESVYDQLEAGDIDIEKMLKEVGDGLFL